jgi:hypothetical protein
VLHQVEALLVAASEERARPAAEAEAIVGALVAEVADNAAVVWDQNRGCAMDVTPLVVASLEARAAGVARDAARELASLRAEAESALAAAAATLGAWEEEEEAARLPGAVGLPVFAGGAAVAEVIVARPATAFVGRPALRRAVRHALAGKASAALREAVAGHVAAVENWRLGSLEALEGRFAGASARLRRRAHRAWPDAAVDTPRDDGPAARGGGLRAPSLDAAADGDRGDA